MLGGGSRLLQLVKDDPERASSFVLSRRLAVRRCTSPLFWAKSLSVSSWRTPIILAVRRNVFIIGWLRAAVSRVFLRSVPDHVINLEDGLGRRMVRQLARTFDIVDTVVDRRGARAPGK